MTAYRINHGRHSVTLSLQVLGLPSRRVWASTESHRSSFEMLIRSATQLPVNGVRPRFWKGALQGWRPLPSLPSPRRLSCPSLSEYVFVLVQ